jgi:hypothetical protein
MSEPPNPELPPALAARIDALCDLFEKASWTSTVAWSDWPGLSPASFSAASRRSSS